MQQPTTQTIYELFNSRIQFRVPVYQRAYVWNETENWAPLWDDIADTANRYMEDPKAQSRHFLGPIVLSQERFEAGGVDPRLVIDGQQRLTTLQIIIAAAVAAARDHGQDDIGAELAELTVNRGRVAQDDLQFKVWPSRRDRKAFLSALEFGATKSATTGIPAAWIYFRVRIEDWVTDEGEADSNGQTERLEALRVCLANLLYVVSINLDESDNAQVIFETLNARGTGLGALDLVKNAIFLQGEREKAATDYLHDEFWEPTFEGDEYWLDETRQGREKRARADWFLMHWLAMELGEVVRADKLFDTFRKRVLHGPDSMSVVKLVPRLCEDANIMRRFDDFVPGTAEQLFFSRLETMDTTTMFPIALFLFRCSELTPERRLRALAALESWLVRRAIMRLTAKNYNRTLSSLLKVIKDDFAHADAAIVEELRSSQATTAIWPNDEVVRSRVVKDELYGYVGQARLRMLLEACELDLRDPAKTEAIALPGGLSIEHALPQAWEENWPLPGGVDQDEAAIGRWAHINRLGNLTLVTQPLNSALSNAPWVAHREGAFSKRDELKKRSVLLINQRLCEHAEWDEARIDARGTELADGILRAWPGPDSNAWPAR
ncbi:MAG TPA: DUF262 domain-containing protein [Candidatus Dormibacteraeota bacterium]|jgi:hypothetical protein|nr:DUF262 domain-containing protein [Candidatus Dormibacteraeota bacterium]